MNDAPSPAGEIGLHDPLQGAPGESDAARRHPGHAPSSLPRRTSNSGLVLVIVAGLSTLVGFVLAAPAVVLGILSMVHQTESPARAARFARWGWVAYAIVMTLMLIAGALLIGVAMYAASGS